MLDLSTNLLSVHAITKSGGEMSFVKNEVIIKYNDKVITKGRQIQSGLFQVKLKAVKESESYLTDSSSDAVTIWHKKLWHISNNNLKTLVQISEGMNLTAEDLKKLEKVCDICQKAKQTRIEFGEAKLREKRPLEIIHSDVYGPINPPTWNGNKYFVTFLDFTHYIMAFLIKSKEGVPRKFKEYVKRVEARWDKCVSKLRCDNGKEFNNDKVITWCEDKGIELDRTVSYKPQLNRRAERLNRILMNKARALLFESKLQKELWGEALLTAVYLTNRSPTDSLKLTSNKMWEDKKPNLKNLQIFGCEAYVKILKPLKKLERSEKCIFIGYTSTGYRLWDKDINYGIKKNGRLK